MSDQQLGKWEEISCMCSFLLCEIHRATEWQRLGEVVSSIKAGRKVQSHGALHNAERDCYSFGKR